MTIEEHMCITYFLMNVRDELYDLARRDENLQDYVEDLEYCLNVLRRHTVAEGLTEMDHVLIPTDPERS